MTKPVSVLFFCLGNICRSPLAEAVMAQYVIDAGLKGKIMVDSAATSTYESGNQPDHRTQSVAFKHGYHLNHQSRQLRPADLEHFDLIIGMEANNLHEAFKLLQPTDDQKAKFKLLRDWDPDGIGIVPDPYFGTLQDFELVQQIMMRTLKPLIKHLQQQFNILL